MSMDKAADIEEQYDKIYRYCYFRLRSRVRAEDITQETFLRFWERKEYQDTGKALRYLYTIARNLCIDDCRRRQRELVSQELLDERLEAMDASRGQEGCGELIESMAVKEALSALPEEDRELLLLRYVAQVPVSALCGLLGISRFAVYRKTSAALKSLRERLGEED